MRRGWNEVGKEDLAACLRIFSTSEEDAVVRGFHRYLMQQRWLVVVVVVVLAGKKTVKCDT